MVVHNEDESGNCSGLSDYGRLGMNDADLCELADPKVLRILFEVVPIDS